MTNQETLVRVSIARDRRRGAAGAGAGRRLLRMASRPRSRSDGEGNSGGRGLSSLYGAVWVGHACYNEQLAESARGHVVLLLRGGSVGEMSVGVATHAERLSGRAIALAGGGKGRVGFNRELAVVRILHDG